VPHVQHPPAALAHNRKGLRQHLIERFLQKPFLLFVELLGIGMFFGIFRILFQLRLRFQGGKFGLNALLEFLGLRAQLVVRELLHLGFKRVNLRNNGQQPLYFALILSAKNRG